MVMLRPDVFRFLAESFFSQAADKILYRDTKGEDDNGGTSVPPETCAGTWVGGYCWYLGAKGQSCDTVCASHGSYHEATRTYAGSHGTDSNCYAVLSDLGAPADSDGELEHYPSVGGCNYRIMDYGVSWRRNTAYTSQIASHPEVWRACACAQ